MNARCKITSTGAHSPPQSIYSSSPFLIPSLHWHSISNMQVQFSTSSVSQLIHVKLQAQDVMNNERTIVYSIDFNLFITEIIDEYNLFKKSKYSKCNDTL